MDQRVIHAPRGWNGSRFDAEQLLDVAGVRAVLPRIRVAYVYVLCRADGRPFYVGKGSCNGRCLEHAREARNTRRMTHKLNVIRSMDRRGEPIGHILETDFETEMAALARERELIALIGRHDLKHGPLTNQTDGGEGTSNPSAESRARHAATLAGEGEDEGRNLANRWFKSIVQVASVPVKNVGRYKIEGLWRNRDSFSMSGRQAGALAASAIANRVLLEPGAILPRRMEFEGVEMVIENGVGRDTLSSGMTELVPDHPQGHEQLQLTSAGLAFLLDSIDRDLLVDAGVLLPED